MRSLRERISEIESSGVGASRPARSCASRRGGRPARTQDSDGSNPVPSLEKTKAKVERLCVQRDQNSLLLKRRLVKEGYDEAFVEEAVGRAVEVGLVDDLRWADMIVRSRISAGKGVAGIRRELSQGGVDIELLPDWPDGYDVDDEDERRRAMAVLAKRPPRAKNKRAAAYRRLVGKGFSSSVAQSVAREWAEGSSDQGD